jgi:hypothetical protein
MNSRLAGAALIVLGFQIASVSPSSAEELTKQSAAGACRLFIMQILPDPSSADFGHSRDATVTLKGSHAMVVRSVRAANGYGAKRLEEFTCLMELRGGTITPVLISQKGENIEQTNALLKKWNMP